MNLDQGGCECLDPLDPPIHSPKCPSGREELHHNSPNTDQAQLPGTIYHAQKLRKVIA